MQAVAGNHRGQTIESSNFRTHDGLFVAAIIALMCIGVVMVYSASIYIAASNPDIGDGTFYLKRQLINVGLGIVALMLGMGMNYRDLRKAVYPLLLVSILALAL